MRSFLASMMVVAACGDDGNNNPLPDAPGFQDSGSDGSGALVTLTVTVGATPQAGVKVYFQNADSSVVLATTTDATGTASTAMAAGGFVTAIDALPVIGQPAGVAPPSRLQTFANVKPGDHLVLHAEPSTATGVQVSVSFLMDDEPSLTATSYEAWTPCGRHAPVNGAGSGAPPGGIVDMDGCPATSDVTVVALNQVGEPFASILKTNVAVSDGATVDLSNLVNTPWVNSQLVSYTYQNVPGSIAGFNVESFQVTPKGIMFETDQSNSINSGNGGVSDVVRPKLDGTSQVDYTTFSGPVNSLFDVLEWGTPKLDYLINDTTLILPHEYTAFPLWDFASNGVTWTADPAGVAPNFVRAHVSFSRGAGVLRWDWEIVDSAASTSVKFPRLPAPDDQFTALATDDTQNIQTLTTGVHPAGYDGVRASLLSARASGPPLELVVGASGQVVFEELQFGKVAAKRGRNPFAAVSRQHVTLKHASR